jgi:SmpA / OmlA family
MKSTEVLIVVCLCFVAVVGSWFLILPPHHIEEASVALIRPGMDQQQVEAILGEPPSKYVGGVHPHAKFLRIWYPAVPGKGCSAGCIGHTVTFEDEKVSEVRDYNQMDDETWIEWIRWRLRLCRT